MKRLINHNFCDYFKLRWLIHTGLVYFILILCSANLYSQKKVNDKERIEKLSRDKGFKITYTKRKWDKELKQRKKVPIKMFDESGYLIELDLSGNKHLEEIDLKDFPKLKVLDLHNCNITDIKLSKLPKSLTKLSLWRNKNLSQVDLKDFKILQKLDLRNCNITDLKLSNLLDLGDF